MSMSERGMGWVPDLPDFRDYILRSPALATLPISASIRDRCSPVRDQGRLGSCVGFSLTAAVEYLRRADADLWSTIYSPLFVYYGARAAEGWEQEDTGAYIRDGIKVLVKTGAAQESAWPYEERRVFDAPSETARDAATRWQLGSYWRCEEIGAVLAALSEGAPVVGGFTCYSSLFTEEVDRSGDVPYPERDDYVLGGHAVLFVGYDQKAGRIYFKNSWGEAWGDGGYGALPLNYAASRSLADDFWALSLESEASFRGLAPKAPT